MGDTLTADPKQKYYIVGHDISGCKCGQGDHSVITYFVQTTRYIETDMDGIGEDLAWKCENCEDARYFGGYHPRGTNFNFCSSCGRKITEFVDYVRDADV